MKSLLRRSKRLRSAYAFLAVCRDASRASPESVAALLEADYVNEDPWHYAVNPAEGEKYTAAVELLDSAGFGRPSAALEIGCGEGFFTEQLAPRCGRLLAVDISSVALERAAARSESHANVTFRRWNVLDGPLLGAFDLVVCMDVLQYVPRPRLRRRAVERVAGAVAPAGALLLSGVLRPAHIEDAWWGRWFSVGARADAARFSASQRRLALVNARETELHLVSLFRAPGA